MLTIASRLSRSMACVFSHIPAMSKGIIHGRLAGERRRLPRDVHRQVADPLQIVVDLHRGNDEPQVDRHRLVQGEHLEALLLDLDLALVDFVVALARRPGPVSASRSSRARTAICT